MLSHFSNLPIIQLLGKMYIVFSKQSQFLRMKKEVLIENSVKSSLSS